MILAQPGSAVIGRCADMHHISCSEWLSDVVPHGHPTATQSCMCVARHVCCPLSVCAMRCMCCVMSCRVVSCRCWCTKQQSQQGDFFKEISLGPGVSADCFVMKSILHDWPDAACITILTNLRKFMPAGSVLVNFDRLMPDDGTVAGPHPAKMMDINMLVRGDGWG